MSRNHVCIRPKVQSLNSYKHPKLESVEFPDTFCGLKRFTGASKGCEQPCEHHGAHYTARCGFESTFPRKTFPRRQDNAAETGLVRARLHAPRHAHAPVPQAEREEEPVLAAELHPQDAQPLGICAAREPRGNAAPNRELPALQADHRSMGEAVAGAIAHAYETGKTTRRRGWTEDIREREKWTDLKTMRHRPGQPMPIPYIHGREVPPQEINFTENSTLSSKIVRLKIPLRISKTTNGVAFGNR